MGEQETVENTFDFLTKRKTKRLEIDESILYDKYCKVCRIGHMIGLWSWDTRSYKSFKCNSLDCDYRN